MKLRLAVILFIAVASASSVDAQSISISPDSATAGATVQVTIAGSGTHFKPTGSVSGFYSTVIALKRSGQTVYTAYPSSIPNDSVLYTSFMVPASMASGAYDLSVVRTQDQPTINYSQASAFTVNPAPAKITTISKSYGYTGQTMSIIVTGFNTNFSGFAGQIAITFKQAGTTIFQTHGDSIISTTKLMATVVIPATASGTFDIGVTNPGFNYSGSQLFTVYPDGGTQSFAITPDSGAASNSIPVTIVGSGTHFTASGNVSGFNGTSIILSRSGQTYYTATSSTIVSDTLMRSTFALPTNLSSGWYDVTISQQMPPFYVVKQTSAFYVSPAPSKITMVSPSSAYQSQTVKMLLYGQNVTFSGPANQIAIDFKQSGTTVFSTVADSILIGSRLMATVTVPMSATAGSYDIVVTDSGRAYPGTRLFTVLSGPPPGITFQPDTGISGDTMAVTIVGQNTNFQPSQGVSVINTVTLRSGGQVYLQTTLIKVSSATSMDATLFLTNIPAGTYDAELKFGQYYDYFTTYTVIPHSFIMPSKPMRDTIRGAGSITLAVVGHGTHFMPLLNTFSTATIENPNVGISSIIQASSVTASNDTALTATFAIPAGAAPGSYDMIVVEPTGTKETLNSALVVQGSSGVEPNGIVDGISDLLVSPNPSYGNVAISFELDRSQRVQLRLFDALGHTAATLCDRTLEVGPQRFEWISNATDGIYFYELTAGTETRTGKIVLAR